MDGASEGWVWRPFGHYDSRMDITDTLFVKDRRAWRRWLEKHHSSKREIWLILYSKASGQPSIPYGDAVEEALCFGWIDGQAKKLGPESRAQRFSPRRKGSPMSELNKERARHLVAQGKMTPAGLVASGDLSLPRFVIPKDIARALKADPEVWSNFQAFSESYKRIRIAWIAGVQQQRPDEAEKRLRYFIKMTKAGKMYGMVR